MPNRRYDEINRPGKNLHRTSAAVSADSLALPTAVENLRKRLQAKARDWPARQARPLRSGGAGSAARGKPSPTFAPKDRQQASSLWHPSGSGLSPKNAALRGLSSSKKMDRAASECFEGSMFRANPSLEGSVLRGINATRNQCYEGSMLRGVNASRDQCMLVGDQRFIASAVAQAPPVPLRGFGQTTPHGQKNKNHDISCQILPSPKSGH